MCILAKFKPKVLQELCIVYKDFKNFCCIFEKNILYLKTRY